MLQLNRQGDLVLAVVGKAHHVLDFICFVNTCQSRPSQCREAFAMRFHVSLLKCFPQVEYNPNQTVVTEA